MTEKKERGRPRKGEAIPKSSEADSTEKGNDIPSEKVQNDDDLEAFLKKNKNESSENSELSDIDNSILQEIQSSEKIGGLGDIPPDNYDPLRDGVKKRDYTSGIANDGHGSPNSIPAPERVIEEPRYSGAGASKPDIDDSLMNPSSTKSNDIPKDDSKKKSDSGSKSESDKEEPKGENIKNLSNAEKRDSVEKTADAILLAYKNYIPIPFVFISSYNEKKLEKYHEANEIDLEQAVKKDGTTFREYVKQFNLQVSEIFEVKQDEITALREPLIDVLMEQEFAFTPAQRLMFTAGQFLVSKTIMAVKLFNEKRSDMEEMREIHREKMDALRAQNDLAREKKDEAEREARKRKAEADRKAKLKSEEDAKLKSEVASEVTPKKESISDAVIISEVKNEETVKEPSLDNAIDSVEQSETDELNNDDSVDDIPS